MNRLEASAGHTSDNFPTIDLIPHIEDRARSSTFPYTQRARKLGGTAISLLSAEERAKITADMARHELQRYDNDTLYIYLLNGGLPFAVDLAKSMCEQSLSLDTPLRDNLRDSGVHPYFRAVGVSRYDGQRGNKGLKFTQWLADEDRTEDREVVIVDDLVDEGDTVRLFIDYMNNGREIQGEVHGPPSAVRVIALAHKGIVDLESLGAQSVTVGVKSPNVWVQESGMNGRKMVKRPDGSVQVIEEYMRHYGGLSVPTTQDEKYKDNMLKLLEWADGLGIAVAGPEEIQYIVKDE